MIRRRLGIAAAVLAVAAILAPGLAPTAAAADDGLALTTSSTYTLVPAKRVVRVSVDVTARNNKPNVVAGGVITRYFYDGFRLGIQPEARNIRATTGGTRLAVSTKPADGYQTVEISFRSSLFFHQTAAVRLTFDLPGGAPRSTSEVRVGPAFATFVSWAFGDSGSVRIVIPAGFEAESSGSEVTRSASGGNTALSATGIVDAASWYAVVNADRRAALTNSPITLADGERINIHAWPDDPEWKSQVTELLTKGLPELVDRTGLTWPVAGELSIFEVHTPLLEGYAGVYFEGQNKIEISEDLDDLTILHEASHAWFNGNLFDGRWINEGFADTYASESLAELGLGDFAPDSVDPTDPAHVPLNDWQFPGRITDDKTDARERYGYDASWTVIRTIYHEIGSDRMRAVIVAADAKQIPYVGAGAPESVVTFSTDWRRLLDLLDEVGGSKTADAQFRRWVVSDRDTALLTARDAARAAYAALVTAGGEWKPPILIRQSMADWSFTPAVAEIQRAQDVLRRRDELADVAARLGLAAPADGEALYENATSDLDPAKERIEGEIEAALAVEQASSAVAAPRDPLVALGLMGTAPEARLDVVRQEFSMGAAETAADAAALYALIGGAAEAGQGRLVLGGVIAIAVLLVLIGFVLLDRRSQARRRALRAAAVTAVPASPTAPAEAGYTLPPAPDAAPPYATLADPTAEPDAAVDPPSARSSDTGDAE